MDPDEHTAALLAGYLLYTPIAHGVTGGHEARALTEAQLIAHSVALAAVAVLVAMAQRRVPVPFALVTWRRVVLAAVAFEIAFWLGYYQPWIEGPDTDIPLCYVVLGSAVWLGNIPTKGHRVAAMVALLSFPVASIVGEVGLLVVFTSLQVTPAMENKHHSAQRVAAEPRA